MSLMIRFKSASHLASVALALILGGSLTMGVTGCKIRGEFPGLGSKKDSKKKQDEDELSDDDDRAPRGPGREENPLDDNEDGNNGNNGNGGLADQRFITILGTNDI